MLGVSRTKCYKSRHRTRVLLGGNCDETRGCWYLILRVAENINSEGRGDCVRSDNEGKV